MLDDVVIEAQEIPEVEGDSVTIGDLTIVIPGVPAAQIPERVGHAGCIVEYDAPGGCLGAVAISEAFIPAYTIPERRLPQVKLPDGTVLDEVVLPAQTVNEVRVAGVRAEEVCQVTADKKEGDFVSSVTRPSLTRSSLTQSSATQASGTRPSARSDGQYIARLYIPRTYAERMYMERRCVPHAYLSWYRLTDDVETSSDDDKTTYTATGDVLFDSDKDTLRPEADPALTAILRDIQAMPDSSTVLVEGHTDNVDTAEYNQDLSRRRAETVAAWLVDHGVDRSRITTVGHGLTHPRADNSTAEGRALNRRVVITVTR